MSVNIIAEMQRLHRERREEMHRRMKDYDETIFYPAMRELYQECRANGHTWQFTNLGPLGAPWFICTTCGATECRGSTGA